MDYKRIYNQFILDRRKRENKLSGYFEKHHIKPKSLGGDDEPENIIKLTPEDHLFAHKLLALFEGGSMWHALHMCNQNGSSCKSIKLSRLWYGKLKRERAKYMSLKMSGSGHHFYGKKLSEEHVEKLVKSHLGQRMGRENNMYDPKKYHFRNFDGRYMYVTKVEFKKLTEVSSARVSDICTGKRNHSKGWYVSKIPRTREQLLRIGENHPSTKKETYKFIHESGISRNCSQFQLRQEFKELNQSHISGLCRGVRNKHKGWKIEQ